MSGGAQMRRLRGRIRGWRLVQLEPEQGAPARASAHAETTAMRFDQALHGSQAEADTGCARVGPADVRLEDPPSQLRWDARARVLDLEEHPAAPPAGAPEGLGGFRRSPGTWTHSAV